MSQILFLQKAARLNTLGRLRMGTSTPGANGGKQPQKSETWVISSPNRQYIEIAAKAFGGVAEAWTNGKEKQWRVITTTDTLPVYVLPFDPHQALERFDDSRRLVTLRCDGVTCKRRNASGRWEESPCECDPENNPRPECGAKLKTRVHFILPVIPAVGTWMLETSGYYAAVEIPTGMQFVRQQGRLVARALLRLEPRRRVDPAGGPDRLFYVPVLHLESTPQHLEALTPGNVPSLGAQARSLTTGEDPLAGFGDDEDEAEKVSAYVADDEAPEADGYTEKQLTHVLSAWDVADDEARGLIARVQPPSLMELEVQLGRLSRVPGVKVPTRLKQLARQSVSLRSWSEFVAVVDELEGEA